MHGRIDAWMHGSLDTCIHGRVDACMDAWKMDSCMGGWMDGCVNECKGCIQPWPCTLLSYLPTHSHRPLLWPLFL